MVVGGVTPTQEDGNAVRRAKQGRETSRVCIPMEVREMLPLRVGNSKAGGRTVTYFLTSSLLESFVSWKLACRVRGRAVGKVP